MTRIVVCASGAGSNFEAIVRASREGVLSAQVVGLITNRGKIGALGRAGRLNVPSQILGPKDFTSREQWDRAMLQQLKEWKADWVVLAGFLALIGPEVLSAFKGRVVNSHPALLPKYGGTGMYGDHVHEAVIQAKESETGVTIHLVDNLYDQGKVLAQQRVAVKSGDTASTLATRVKALETAFYPRVLNDLVTGRITTS